MLAAGVQVAIYAGDADFLSSWVSNKREAESIVWPRQAEFADAPLAPYTVSGTERGLIKTVGNLAYLKVFEAGHDLAYFRESFAPYFPFCIPGPGGPGREDFARCIGKSEANIQRVP